jgi:SAM-dependent methyltransferase
MERIPEPHLIMDSAQAIDAWDKGSDQGGPLVPLYHFNMLAVSRMLPKNGYVVDLACGSGRFLVHLSSGRPDLKCLGVELSAGMLAQAERNVRAAGMQQRVSFRQGDIRKLSSLITEHVDLVTCVLSLHHLPTEADLLETGRAIQSLRERTGCGVWLFDLVRPASDRLIEWIPLTYECVSGVKLSPAFKEDWMHSLRAGWRVEELTNTIRAAGLKLASSEADMSQVHWVTPTSVNERREIPKWDGTPLTVADNSRFLRICNAFGTVQCF